jgi:hypothetical protein
MSALASDESPKAAAAPSPKRFTVLLIFGCISFLYAGSFICFAPIADLAAKRFDVGVGEVNNYSTVYFVLYLPGTLLQLYLVDSFGVRTCLRIASVLSTCTLAVRYAALVSPSLTPHGAYSVGLAAQARGCGERLVRRPRAALTLAPLARAQLVSGTSQATALNLASRIAGDWFPSAERDVATTAATMANVLGLMALSLYVPLLVRTPEELSRCLLLLLLPGMCVTVACFTHLEERPAVPPSTSAALQWREREAEAANAKGSYSVLATMLHDMRGLAHNKNFVLLAAGFAVGTGTVWAMLVLESQLITPCGYSDALAGAAGAALLGAGFVAAFITGIVMETTKMYLHLQRFFMVAAVLATAGVFAAAKPGNGSGILFAWGCLGCALQPLMPLTLEHAAEITFPLPADVSTAALFVVANLFGLVFTIIMTPLLHLPASAQCAMRATPAALATMALMSVGLALTLSVKKQYARSAAEHPSEPEEADADSPLLGHQADGTFSLYPRYT